MLQGEEKSTQLSMGKEAEVHTGKHQQILRSETKIQNATKIKKETTYRKGNKATNNAFKRNPI